ncbi:MAG: TetR/AcrR family transcriptional regulator [Phycisphaerae bacterium]|nr:TetR/AcrR family transcriptional regulator [Phycisphaerae bacterium]NIX27772.1 TetR family transcriptional regulator [Phycisphaerae bacterium]
MTQTTREQFLETTCNLIETQGYYATGLNQIIKESGAPKGSLYYHFPNGKEELVADAIDLTGLKVSERIELNLASEPDPAKAVWTFIHRIADNVELSGFSAGGPLMTVAMETVTSSERINLACREAYGRLVQAFEAKLLSGRYSEKRAAELAVFIVTAVEGGILLSRTNHTSDPLRLVADELRRLLDAATN